MRVKKGWSIENKILIPFLIISILSTMTFAAILYYSGYKLKMVEEMGTAGSLIGYIEADINAMSGIVYENVIREKYARNPERNIFIYDRAGNMIAGGRSLGGTSADRILYESDSNEFRWKVCYIVDMDEFGDSLVEEQKYIILATIALIIVIVQLSIFIASNISTPIRILSDTCRTISKNPDRSLNVDVGYTGRRDEIGQLATSFERMLCNFRSYTEEIVRVKQLNESIVENLPIGLVVYDEKGETILINTAARNLLDKTEYQCDRRTVAQMLDSFVGEPKWVDSVRFSDGECRVLDLSMGVWRLLDRDQSQWGTLCTLDDVTYKKMMEERYSENEKLAYAGKLAASLAHEIRNPLAGIRASIQVIGRRVERSGDKMLCDSILGEVDRVNMLIENLVNLARRRDTRKSVLYITALYEELMLFYSKIAENSRIEMHSKTDAEITLYADADQLKQVLINLINNSIKAMPGGGRIELGSRIKDTQVELWVSDDGKGMTEQEQQEAYKSMETGGGSGLGFSIVARLLGQNGGKLAIVSAPGVGTTVTMTFEGKGGAA